MDPLDRLPDPNERRLAVRVTPDALRHVRSGHPWVFGDSVVHVGAEGAAGDLAVIFDAARRFAAIGLYDPGSPIRIRVLHHGRPVPIDDAWWAARLEAALDIRATLASSSETTGYRCVNGENDGFPGLVLDRYDATYVLKLYSTAWLPHLRMLVDLLRRRLAPERLILRLSRGVQRSETFGLVDGVALIGTVPDAPVLFRENGLVFEADVVRGQKTGHFFDQRDNRARVRDLSAGADVLDVFACTGGFSVYAAAGGAVSVHSIDLSAPTLATAERNMAHNRELRRVAACRHTIEVADAFDAMRELGRRSARFDVVVVDPPSFAQKQADVRGALQAYRRLTELATVLVAPGGVLVQASCSSRVGAEAFHDAVLGTIERSGRHAHVLARTTHAVDHPVTFAEGAYLKAVFVRIG
ncbi:MAG: class I SAM-dependent rRNA methyltransferase [Acidimicrobiia bacterium]